MPRELYNLTDEHREMLVPWAQRWIANAMSTAAMDEDDRAACRLAVIGMYAAAGLPSPRVIFVPSPFVARFAGGFAASIWHATRAATWAATGHATEDATRAATEDATWAATWAATEDATGDKQTNWYVIGSDMRACAAACTEHPEFALACAAQAWRLWQDGNQDSGYEAYLSFFQDVAGLSLPEYERYQHWRTLAERSGPRIVHAEFCIISDRPEVLTVDESNRPHNDTGPFCRWRDGSALYAVHGVRVPAWIVERPEAITLDAIDAEANNEVQRVMIERFGWDRYAAESGAEVVDHDERWGTLRRRRAGAADVLFLEVVNGSPEPDGTFRRYVLPVSPRCEPLPDPTDPRGELGRPQALTALNAVASTYGLTGKQYAQLAVRT